MITAIELKERMHAQPFKPFRLCLSDGKTYDINNHDMAWVIRGTVYVGLNLDANDFESIRVMNPSVNPSGSHL